MRHHNATAIFFATFILTVVPSLHSQTSSVWDGSDGDWSDASKWSSDSAPRNVQNGETFDVEIASGNVNLDIGVGIDSLTFSGGEISGPNSLSIVYSDSVSTMNWTGGTLSYGGFEARAYVGGTLNISGTENLVLDRTLSARNVNWQSNDILSPSGFASLITASNFSDTPDFLISGGAEDRIIQTSYAGETLAHNRNGKTVFAGDDFQNLVSIAVNQGTMEVHASSLYAQKISMHSNDSTFRILGDSTHRLFDVSGGTGNLEIGNGRVEFDGSFDIGRLEIGEDGRLDLLESASNSANSIVNKGHFQSIEGGFSIDSDSFINEGTIFWAASNPIEISGMDQNSGTLRILGGQLVSSEAININGGSLSGYGNIEGDVNVGSSGTVALDFGLFNIDGDFAIAGIFDLDVRGSLVEGMPQDETLVNSSSNIIDYEQLNVFGTATIADGATINLNFDSDYIPLSGDFFDILTADSIVANLDQIVFDTSIFEYSTEILTLNDPGFGTRQTLRFTVLNAVPEPSGVAFLLSVVLCGVLKRRRTA